MGTLIDVQEAIQSIARALPGVRSAPSQPPDSPAAYPFVVTLPAQGGLSCNNEGWFTGLHTLQTEIHVCRRDMTYDAVRLITLLQAFYRALMASPTLSGTVSTVNDVRYYWRTMEWAGQETRGYLIQIDVKLQETS